MHRHLLKKVFFHTLARIKLVSNLFFLHFIALRYSSLIFINFVFNFSAEKMRCVKTKCWHQIFALISRQRKKDRYDSETVLNDVNPNLVTLTELSWNHFILLKLDLYKPFTLKHFIVLLTFSPLPPSPTKNISPKAYNWIF